jgi:hypothetical protein
MPDAGGTGAHRSARSTAAAWPRSWGGASVPRFSDEAFATIGTSLAPLLLAAAEAALAEAQADPAGELQPSIVAILCAATALEAATNWAADRGEPGWLDQPQPDTPGWPQVDLALARKWATWIEHRTGKGLDLGGGLGQRVVSLADDRNLIAHDLGVVGPDGKRRFHLPPDTRSGRSRVRTYFTALLAEKHLRTAQEAIAALTG